MGQLGTHATLTLGNVSCPSILIKVRCVQNNYEMKDRQQSIPTERTPSNFVLKWNPCVLYHFSFNKISYFDGTRFWPLMFSQLNITKKPTKPISQPNNSQSWIGRHKIVLSLAIKVIIDSNSRNAYKGYIYTMNPVHQPCLVNVTVESYTPSQEFNLPTSIDYAQG